MIDFNKPTKEKSHSVGNGTQKIWRFENGFGASVVRFKLPFSSFDGYGSYTDDETEWELAVVKFEGKGVDKFELKYDTEITDDVMGHLKEKDVVKVLKKIEKLK